MALSVLLLGGTSDIGIPDIKTYWQSLDKGSSACKVKRLPKKLNRRIKRRVKW
jgi:hypothetical protein